MYIDIDDSGDETRPSKPRACQREGQGFVFTAHFLFMFHSMMFPFCGDVLYMSCLSESLMKLHDAIACWQINVLHQLQLRAWQEMTAHRAHVHGTSNDFLPSASHVLHQFGATFHRDPTHSLVNEARSHAACFSVEPHETCTL